MKENFNPYSEEGNKLIQGWIREFDEICKTQKGFNNYPCFIDFKGEEMNIEKFLEYKINKSKL